MALVQYQNYTFPFRGFGQTSLQPVTTQDSWTKRNWGTLLQILGSLFVVSGTIVQQWINSRMPAGEKIAADDWETLVQTVQRMYPQLSRQEIEKKLCELFGARSPYCLPGGIIYPAPPTTTGIPSWIWMVAIGVGAFLLLK